MAINGFAFTDSKSEAKQESIRKKLVDELISEKLSLEEMEKTKRQLLSSLYELNVQMKRVNKDKARLMDEMYVAETKVNRLTRIIAGIEEKIKAERAKLKVELTTVIQIADQGALRLLFSSKSSNEFDRDLKFLRLLIDQNYKGIKEFQRLVKLHNEQKKVLKVNIAKLTELRERIKKKEEYIGVRQKEKKQIITKMEAKSRMQMSAIGNLKEQTKSLVGRSGAIDDQLVALLQTSFFENKGRLTTPINGEVARDFGPIKDDTFSIILASKGLFYKTPVGRKVKSVYSGTVEFAGKIKSFGKTVVIDHGDHYYSVYSHLNDVLVEPGDQVSARQSFATAGNSSLEFGSGIYFEIRHFSEPENPNFWLRANGSEEIP